MKRAGGMMAMLLALAVQAGAAQAARPLIEVLEAYEAEGFAFIYSSDLVRPTTEIEFDPSGGLSIPALQSALRDIGLGLKRSEGANGEITWLVVLDETAESPERIEGRGGGVCQRIAKQ